MASSLRIDNELIQGTLRLGEHPTKRAVVEERYYVSTSSAASNSKSWSCSVLSYNEDYDYKRQRKSQ